MATKVQRLRQRIAQLRDDGVGTSTGHDCFFTEDMTDAENAIRDAQQLFRDARRAITAATKTSCLFNAMLSLQRAEGLIESWEQED